MSSAGGMPIQDYVFFALKELQTETNIRVLAQLTESAVASVNLLYRLQPESQDALAERNYRPGI
jgi:hypothetical protein